MTASQTLLMSKQADEVLAVIGRRREDIGFSSSFAMLSTSYPLVQWIISEVGGCIKDKLPKAVFHQKWISDRMTAAYLSLKCPRLKTHS